jgi:hypothetical protein
VFEVRAELGERLAHALEDVLGLALEARRTERWKALGAFDLDCRAVGEVEGFVPGQEKPGSGFHCIGVRHGAAGKPFDGADFDIRHGGLPRMVDARIRRRGERAC